MTQPSIIKHPNGMVYIDGQWYLECGPDLIKIKYSDTSGKPVEPTTIKVSSS